MLLSWGLLSDTIEPTGELGSVKKNLVCCNEHTRGSFNAPDREPDTIVDHGWNSDRARGRGGRLRLGPTRRHRGRRTEREPRDPTGAGGDHGSAVGGAATEQCQERRGFGRPGA